MRQSARIALVSFVMLLGAPLAASASSAAAVPVVTVAAATAVATATTLPIPFTCSGATCTGTASAAQVIVMNFGSYKKSIPTKVGTATFSIPDGKTSTVVFSLNTFGRLLLATAIVHHTNITVSVVVQGGKPVTKVISVS